MIKHEGTKLTPKQFAASALADLLDDGALYWNERTLYRDDALNMTEREVAEVERQTRIYVARILKMMGGNRPDE